GNRCDRRHARLKYLLAERGVDWLREELRRRGGFALRDWRDMDEPVCKDHLGRHPHDNGRWFYGLAVESGRIKDQCDYRIRSALKKIAEDHRPGFTLTAHQNILLTGLSESALDDVERTLEAHGITPTQELSGLRRFAMACPALPTCGLAMSESERVLPSILARFETLMESLGMRNEPVSFRMTGCPNGCARPYTADIALVGRRVDVYHVYVGGGLSGDRVVDLYAADVHRDDLVDPLRPLLVHWAATRHDGEGLSDCYQRLLGRAAPRQVITGKEEPTMPLIQCKLPA
ncbi:MAG: hypothetical protein ACE5EX_06705, partial [Phycisphaerae bacterium]